jgi:hypothetical protein
MPPKHKQEKREQEIKLIFQRQRPVPAVGMDAAVSQGEIGYEREKVSSRSQIVVECAKPA